MNYDVFISYSRKDCFDNNGNIIEGNSVYAILQLLERNNISYWFDKNGIYHGDRFTSVISKSIRQSKVFIFISSKNSNESIWTTREIHVADKIHKPIIPINIDGTSYNDDIMLQIATLDYVDYYKNPSLAQETIIKSLNKLIQNNEIPTRRITLVADKDCMAYFDGNYRGKLTHNELCTFEISEGQHNLLFRFVKRRRIKEKKLLISIDSNTDNIVSTKLGQKFPQWIYFVIASIILLSMFALKPWNSSTPTAPIIVTTDSIASPEESPSTTENEMPLPKNESNENHTKNIIDNKDLSIYYQSVDELYDMLQSHPTAQQLINAKNKLEYIKQLEHRNKNNKAFDKSALLEDHLDKALSEKSDEYVNYAYETCLKSNNDSAAIDAYLIAKSLKTTNKVKQLEFDIEMRKNNPQKKTTK